MYFSNLEEIIRVQFVLIVRILMDNIVQNYEHRYIIFKMLINQFGEHIGRYYLDGFEILKYNNES